MKSSLHADQVILRELRRLETRVEQAQREQEAQQALVLAHTNRNTAAQAMLTAAQASFATSGSNFAAVQAAAQNVQQVLAPAREAKAQADTIVNKFEPVLQQAHDTAALLVEAMESIERLNACVQERKGKNELISQAVLTSATQAKADAAIAFDQLTTVLKNTMAAYAAAQLSAGGTDDTIALAREIAEIVAGPLNENDAPAANHDPLKNATPPVESIRDLAVEVFKKGPSVLAVVDKLVVLGRKELEQRQAAAARALHGFSEATHGHAKAIAVTAAASASLTAAQAAVA